MKSFPFAKTLRSGMLLVSATLILFSAYIWGLLY